MEKHILSITFESAFHHGSGFGIPGILDRTLLRDGYGMPYLAGSAVKGRLRYATLRLVVSTGGVACAYADSPATCSGRDRCALCELFGSPRAAGSLWFSDAYPTEPNRLVLQELGRMRHPGGLWRDSSTRAAVAIDRERRTARPGFLFTTETLDGGLVFESAVVGSVGAHKTLLEQAARLISGFGAGVSHGLGRCTSAFRGVA